MEEITTLYTGINWATFTAVAIKICKALGVFILGIMLSKWASKTIRRRLGNEKGLQVNDTIRPMLATMARYGIMLATLYAALTIAGIPASSLLAVFGAAGLAIALAVQGTLSNVAAGMMLIFLRAIRVGEYIATPSVEGTVLEIGLFTTQIRGPNGVLITVPNAQIWSAQITNYSRVTERRIDINIELSRDNDVGTALSVLKTTLLSSPHLIRKDDASLAITTTTAQSVTLQARAWITAENVRGHTSDISLALGTAVRAKGYKLPVVLPKV